VLVDPTGHACLADFGLLTIISETTNPTTSTQGGTTRWMSPERFGLKKIRPTKPSDCYALGMVIYEVLSGQVPFYRYGDAGVVVRVLQGKRPGRPRGAERKWFTDDVRRVLEGCWEHKPDDRPSVESVLRCLEEGSGFWTPLPRMVGDSATTNSPTWSSADPSGEGSTEEGETPSLSQPLSPLPKGDVVAKIPIPIIPDMSTALLCDVTNTDDRGGSKFAAVLDKVGWM